MHDAAFWALRDSGNATEGEGQYKIASCAVHFTGALLLDPRDAELLDEHLEYRQEAAAAPEPQDAGPAGAGAADMVAGDDDDAAAHLGGGWSDDERMADMPCDTAAEAAAAGHAAQPGAFTPPHTRGAAAAQAGAGEYADEDDDDEDDFDPWAPLDYSDPTGAWQVRGERECTRGTDAHAMRARSPLPASQACR